MKSEDNLAKYNGKAWSSLSHSHTQMHNKYNVILFRTQHCKNGGDSAHTKPIQNPKGRKSLSAKGI